jgi:hypothetical protein
MHFGFGRLPATPLSFLRHVPLVICHSISSEPVRFHLS